MNINVGCLQSMFKIIWVIKEESWLKKEMHKECTNILMIVRLMKMGGWEMALGYIDVRSRNPYQYFIDITFDTTYLTYCYGIPFVPFTRVNQILIKKKNKNELTKMLLRNPT